MRTTTSTKAVAIAAGQLAACTLLCFNGSSAFNNAVFPHSSSTFLGRTSGWTTTSLAAQRRGRPKGPVRTIEVKPPMNNEIEQNELRVVTPNPKGKDDILGVMSKAEALEMAKELGGLDLILINPNADPPVCSIQDYSKYRYNKEKKSKEKKKANKSNELKEVKMTYKIDSGDYNVRKKSADKFINQGNRVKCTIQFKGREVQHEKLGVDLLNRLAADLTKICVMEGKPKREGRSLSCIMTPRPEITKNLNEKKRKEDKEKKQKSEERKILLKEKKEAAIAAGIDVVDVDEEISGLDRLLDDDDDDTTLDDLLDVDSISGDLGDLFG